MVTSGTFATIDWSTGSYFVRTSLDGLEPVSYTHLRAHETALDLVCRLLLEKKKNYRLLPRLSDLQLTPSI